ncbi:uncharacterized protein LOC131233837 [Magnolia sinica]|uniref:uncharacterized protein LOC131233837 n=1 Tax=Magnolia sinica TaxID=86752 RepID=UPI00265AEE83|nr:uncharacterized protein LOC131233837 [Magnolia sinica]
MVKLNCFTAFFGKKKNSKKEIPEILNWDNGKMGHGTLQVKLEQLVSSPKENGSNATSFNVSVPFGIQGSSTCKVKVVREENTNSIRLESAEAAYEGSNENNENSPIRRDLSDFDLPAHDINKGDETEPSINKTSGSYDLVDTEMNGGSERDEGVEMAQSGHISDPGIGKTDFWGSPKLKRSCSHLGTQDLLKKFTDQLAPSKSQSFGDLQNSTQSGRDEIIRWTQFSPLSVMTSRSADKVMLKRRSSRQLLPSRSRRLWWKLFLWSHRNLHKPGPTKPMPIAIADASNQKDGYWSDTLESSQALAAKNNWAEMGKLDLSRSLYGESKKNHRGGNGSGGGGLSAQSQWVAFPIESSSHLSRVDEWVNSLDAQSVLPLEDHDEGSEGETRKSIDYPLSPEKAPLTTRHSTDKLVDEVLQANNVIQSMNSFSTVAHLAGIGLKVVPNISPFTSLRSVNLSGNFIVHITPGSLPKSLQTLNLSRNKIAAIDGLRELTRLRVLDLSYNRISRIGRGLSNCTLIKELYLTGNKISDVEGLHRHLKLTVIDLSFNKITTAKALGQLAANYKSLLALNLLGNPIQTNIGDDQLRKAASSLLPHLAYLNKQPIKPQRAREVAMDSVAKAALGNGGWNSRRKLTRRVGQGSPLTKGRGNEGGGRRGRHRSKPINHQQSPITRRLST